MQIAQHGTTQVRLNHSSHEYLHPFKMSCRLLSSQTTSGKILWFDHVCCSRSVERPAKALSHQRALSKNYTNPITETQRWTGWREGGSVHQCTVYSVEIKKVRCRLQRSNSSSLTGKTFPRRRNYKRELILLLHFSTRSWFWTNGTARPNEKVRS